MESIQQLPPMFRCQSCGLCLITGHFGTNSDNSENHFYCNDCFCHGIFINPDLTIEDAITSYTQHLLEETELDYDRATELASAVIPSLKRWQ